MSQPDSLLDRADAAMARQSWLEAWALLEQVNPDYNGSSRHLGARRLDFMMLTAGCLRHRGKFEASEKMYRQLIEELSLADSRLAEALMGLGDALHARGKLGEAVQMLRAATKIPDQDPNLILRVATTQAHIYYHLDLKQSLEMFQQATKLETIPVLEAHLDFSYGEALMLAGRFEEAAVRLYEARGLAEKEGLAVTLADCIGRISLLHAIQRNTSSAMTDLADIVNAMELYKASGDRGEIYLHTEHGEVLRALGRDREAETEFKRGLWASREIGDLNRQGHNLLGLYEISRAIGRPQPELLEQAGLDYSKSDSDWGMIHCAIAAALSAPDNRQEILSQAVELIEKSHLSDFPQERQLLNWIKMATPGELSQEPHLMNYP